MCVDYPVEIASKLAPDEIPPEPLKRGEWLAKQSEAKQREILGVGRSKLFQSGAATFDDLYRRSRTPLAVGKPLRDIMADLEHKPKSWLVNAADNAGIDITGLTRLEIIAALAGKRNVVKGDSQPV